MPHAIIKTPPIAVLEEKIRNLPVFNVTRGIDLRTAELIIYVASLLRD